MTNQDYTTIKTFFLQENCRLPLL